MADANVIQEFLVSLGFKVDEAGHKKFMEAMEKGREGIKKVSEGLKHATEELATLAVEATGAAIGIGEAILKIGDSIARLSFAAGRIGAPAKDIQAFEFAIKQLGGTAEEARGALERLAYLRASNPGLLRMFGVGDNVDPVQALMQLGERWSKMTGEMGQKQALEQARQLGINRDMMLRLENPETRQQYAADLARQGTMGLDWDKLTETAKKQHEILNTIQQTFQELGQNVYQQWGNSIVNGLDMFKNWLETNTPTITSDIGQFKKGFDDVATSASNVFNTLTPNQQKLATAGAALAGIALTIKGGAGLIGKAGAMLGVPGLGLATEIIGVYTAIEALTADYNTWYESGGKKGLIDWSVWKPAIDAVKAALKDLNENYIFPLTDRLGVDRSLIAPFEALAAFIGGPRLVKPLIWLITAMGALGLVSAGALAALGITYTENLNANQKMYKKADEMGYDKVGGNSITDPIPTFKDRKTGKVLTFDQMRVLQGGAPDTNPVRDFMDRMWNGTNYTGSEGGGMEMGSPGFGNDNDEWGIGRGGAGAGAALTQYGVQGGPGDTTPPAPMGAHMAIKANELMSILVKQFGITPEQASGIVANWVSESGLDPAAVNQTSGALGLMQWLGPRKKALLDYAASQGTGWWDLQTQLKFWWQEFGASGSEAKAGNEFRAATTSTAATLAGYNSERPGASDHTYNTRVANAARMLRNFNQPSALTGGSQTPTAPLPYVTGANNNSKNVNVATGNTHINITGVNDPQRVAELVDRSTDRTQQNLIHHLRTAYV